MYRGISFAVRLPARMRRLVYSVPATGPAEGAGAVPVRPVEWCSLLQSPPVGGPASRGAFVFHKAVCGRWKSAAAPLPGFSTEHPGAGGKLCRLCGLAAKRGQSRGCFPQTAGASVEIPARFLGASDFPPMAVPKVENPALFSAGPGAALFKPGPAVVHWRHRPLAGPRQRVFA